MKIISRLNTGQASSVKVTNFIAMVATTDPGSKIFNFSPGAENYKEEMEQLAHAASHDLLAPLRTIKSFFDLFQSKFKDDLDLEDERFVEIIDQSVSRMREMLKGIADYTKIGLQAEINEVDCSQLVEDAKTFLHSEINSSKAVVYVNHLPVISGYASELQLLFQILISNAIKFKRPGVDPLIEISAAATPGGWTFRVKDNGTGIEKIYIEKLFRVFHRIHNGKDYAGNGMGLAIAKKIVSVHGGNIWMESVPGEGSTFNFIIPG